MIKMNPARNVMKAYLSDKAWEKGGVKKRDSNF